MEGNPSLEDSPNCRQILWLWGGFGNLPMSTLKLLSPSACSGYLWTHLGSQYWLRGLEGPELESRRGCRKGRNKTHRKKLKNQGGSRRPGPQGCAIALLWVWPPPSSPLPVAAGSGQPRVRVTEIVQWPRDIWLLSLDARPTMAQLDDFMRKLSLPCGLLLRAQQPTTFPFSRLLVS